MVAFVLGVPWFSLADLLESYPFRYPSSRSGCRVSEDPSFWVVSFVVFFMAGLVSRGVGPGIGGWISVVIASWVGVASGGVGPGVGSCIVIVFASGVIVASRGVSPGVVFMVFVVGGCR